MIAADTLDALTVEVGVDPAIARLRGCFPALHFTECSEDDVPVRATPVRETASHLIYLVSGASGHCLALTHDPETATGVLVASRVADED